MNLAATIARMKEAGMTAEAIVTALQCIVESNPQPAASLDEIRAERKREADRQRMAESRATVALQSRDTDKKKVPDKEIPHTPLEINLQEKAIIAREETGGVSDQAFAEWNALASELGLPQAQFLTAERRQKLRARLAECGGLDGWRAALNKIRGSPHCRGENDRGWRANLDFVLQRKSFTKLMEGNYDERPAAGIRPNSGSRAQNDDILDAIVAEARRRENGGGGGVLPEADPWAA